MRIALTGATGLLGRNLLFEIIKQNLNNLDKLEIFILGREKFNMHIEHRIEQIVLNDGRSYLSIDKNQNDKLKDYCNRGIKSIQADLDEEKLGMSQEDFDLLKSAPIDLFFHIAALTDFRSTPTAVNALKRTNVYGTQQIIDLISSIKVREFSYIGTSYACGYTGGVLKPDYINLNQKFRNAYEQTKLEAEIMVRNFAKKSRMRCRYFRPSTIGGRLLEQPLGAINKFDVFYGWGAFFLRMKVKNLKVMNDIYGPPFDMDMRLCFNKKSGLNIVPADYAAKVMYEVCIQNDTGDSYYLVNNQETPHNLYLLYMLNAFNIRGIEVVATIPHDMNKWERLYYKTVGHIYTPYINCEPMLFDVSNLNNVLHKASLKCPPVDENNFPILTDYAKKYNFGIDIKDLKTKTIHTL